MENGVYCCPGWGVNGRAIFAELMQVPDKLKTQDRKATVRYMFCENYCVVLVDAKFQDFSIMDTPKFVTVRHAVGDLPVPCEHQTRVSNVVPDKLPCFRSPLRL